MRDFFSHFWSDFGFQPHGHCYTWDAVTLWLSVISDGLIALAYFSIPYALWVIARRREDLMHRGLFFLFAAFIFLCGVTHIFGIIGMWKPYYRIDAVLRLTTGLVSIATSYILWQNLPKILSIPSQAQMAEAQAKAHQEELLREREAAANRMKSEFLANMSHEIRTPLNGVIGMLDVLNLSRLDNRQRECVEVALDASERLLHIINDVLDLSKIEAGKLLFNEADFLIREVAESVMDLLRLQADEKHLAFPLRIAPGVPEAFHGDSARISQILINLLSNAIKFTRQGSVELSIVCLEVKDEQATLEFRVHDTGIGIPEERQKAIFEAFTQQDASVQKHFGGTGLGLTIASQLSRMMGGGLSVTSEVGVGSTFTARVILKVAPHAMAPARPEPASPTPASPAQSMWRVLLIEDSAANRSVLTYMLTHANYEVVAVESAEEAWPRVQAEAFDLLIVDVRLPGETGLEFTQRVRAWESAQGGRRRPIVGLSAQAMREDIEQGIAMGMDAYLTKPVRRQELLRLVDHLREQATK